MRSRCLYLLTAALVLLCVSAEACAIAHAPQLKTALRACASLVDAAPGQSADVSASRTKEKGVEAAKCTVGVGVDGNGNLETQRDAKGIVTTNTFDAANQKTRSERSGSTESWTYTATNQIKTHTDLDGRTTTFDYDTRDRLIEETNAEGEARVYEYDLNNNRTVIQLPNGRRWVQTFDSANRLTRVKTPENHTTTFTHSADDQLKTITDANTQTVNLTSDALARITARIYPGGATFATLFDGEGNPKTETHPDTNITRTFDALNRATAEAFAGGAALNLNTTFDPRGNPLTHRATQAGRTLGSTRRFDDLDRLEGDEGQANADAPAIPNAYTHNQRYVLDANGNRLTEIDANGKTTTRTFDDFNRVLTSTTPGEGTTTNTWNRDGTPQSVAHSNGTATRYTYDRAGRTTSVTHSKNGATTLSFVYQYDRNGNRTNEIKTQSAINGQAGSITTTVNTFDGDDRLLSEAITHQPPSATSPDEKKVYTLDGVGNRLTAIVTRTQTNTITSNKSFQYSARNQLLLMTDSVNQLTVAYTYSGNGNRISRTVTQQGQPAQTTAYLFDARDRLIKAQPNAPNTANAPTIDYVYDADARQVERIETPAGGGTPTATLYVYNGQTLLHEADPSNGAGGLRISGTYRTSAQLDRHIAYAQSGGTDVRFYQLDVLQTPVALTDSNGDTVTRTAYSAWGEIEEQTANGITQAPWQLPNYNSDVTGQAALLRNDDQSIGFVGMRKDEDTGLYYAQARWYDPLIGNFNAMDPVFGIPTMPASYHGYLYALANPLTHVDRDGRCADAWCGWGFAMGYAETNEQRKAATRAMFNSNPTLGRTGGAVVEAYDMAKAPIDLAADVSGAVVGDAQAQSHMGARFDAAVDDAQGNAMSLMLGPNGPAIRQSIQFAQRVMQHAKQMDTAIEQHDYVGQGQAGARLTVDAAEVIAVGYGATKLVRVAMPSVRTLDVDRGVRTDSAHGPSTTPIVANVPEQAALGTVSKERPSTVEPTTAPAPSSIAADGVPRTGPRGVDPDHHNANVLVTDADGNIIHHERIVSGNMTPEERALPFPRNTLASHTEARAVRNITLEEGQAMVITGQLPPCPTCKGAMNKTMRETGAMIEYQWREDGVTRKWPPERKK